MYLCFEVHKLADFSSNPGRGHLEGLVHLLRYIRVNNNLGLKHYAKIEDATISDLLIQDDWFQVTMYTRVLLLPRLAHEVA